MVDFDSLNLADLFEWGREECVVVLTDLEFSRIRRAHAKLEEIVANTSTPIYGIDTWYGVDCNVESDRKSFEQNQLALLNFLHVGVGDYLSDETVRRALKLQLKKIALGHSGVSLETSIKLQELANCKNLPKVPMYGSLGASGDLIPMAHAVKPIFALGVSGRRDVLGLVNTNSMMCSLAIESSHELDKLFNQALRNVAIASVALATPCVMFDSTHKVVDNFIGLRFVSEKISEHRKSLCGNKRLEREGIVQDKYSIRCAPQVLGALHESMIFADSLVLGEAISLADNPVIVEDQLCHGGLFYTSRLSIVTNIWTDCIGKIADILDRQMFLLISPKESNLPVNLQISVDDHVKGIHQLISSLNQQIRTCSVPSFLHAVPSEGYNQDIVPATMASLHSIRERLRILTQIVRASAFISKRAACMRLGKEIGENLTLAAWQEGKFND